MANDQLLAVDGKQVDVSATLAAMCCDLAAFCWPSWLRCGQARTQACAVRAHAVCCDWCGSVVRYAAPGLVLTCAIAPRLTAGSSRTSSTSLPARYGSLLLQYRLHMLSQYCPRTRMLCEARTADGVYRREPAVLTRAMLLPGRLVLRPPAPPRPARVPAHPRAHPRRHGHLRQARGDGARRLQLREGCVAARRFLGSWAVLLVLNPSPELQRKGLIRAWTACCAVLTQPVLVVLQLPRPWARVGHGHAPDVLGAAQYQGRRAVQSATVQSAARVRGAAVRGAASGPASVAVGGAASALLAPAQCGAWLGR
eukprot:2964165-Rhodomonas_salina.2